MTLVLGALCNDNKYHIVSDFLVTGGPSIKQFSSKCYHSKMEWLKYFFIWANVIQESELDSLLCSEYYWRWEYTKTLFENQKAYHDFSQKVIDNLLYPLVESTWFTLVIDHVSWLWIIDFYYWDWKWQSTIHTSWNHFILWSWATTAFPLFYKFLTKDLYKKDPGEFYKICKQSFPIISAINNTISNEYEISTSYYILWKK